MNEELKPCPFCGAPADIAQVYDDDGRYKWFYSAFCTNILNCGAAVDGGVWYDDDKAAKTDAIRRWNRRAE